MGFFFNLFVGSSHFNSVLVHCRHYVCVLFFCFFFSPLFLCLILVQFWTRSSHQYSMSVFSWLLNHKTNNGLTFVMPAYLFSFRFILALSLYLSFTCLISMKWKKKEMPRKSIACLLKSNTQAILNEMNNFK